MAKLNQRRALDDAGDGGLRGLRGKRSAGLRLWESAHDMSIIPLPLASLWHWFCIRVGGLRHYAIIVWKSRCFESELSKTTVGAFGKLAELVEELQGSLRNLCKTC